MTQLAKNAKAASRELAKLTTAEKNACLLAMATALEQNAAAIGPVPSALGRMAQVYVRIGFLAESQVGKAIRNIALAAVGHILRDINVFAGNHPSALGADWNGHGVDIVAARLDGAK